VIRGQNAGAGRDDFARPSKHDVRGADTIS
jgi:hypothetical protein